MVIPLIHPDKFILAGKPCHYMVISWLHLEHMLGNLPMSGSALIQIDSGEHRSSASNLHAGAMLTSVIQASDIVSSGEEVSLCSFNLSGSWFWVLRALRASLMVDSFVKAFGDGSISRVGCSQTSSSGKTFGLLVTFLVFLVIPYLSRYLSSKKAGPGG